MHNNNNSKKMQSKMSECSRRRQTSPVLSFGKLDRTHVSSFILANLLHYVNMTSSTKPEVHNMLQCYQRRIEPHPQITCTENLVQFGRVVFEMSNRTDKQTEKQKKQTERNIDTLVTIPRNPTTCKVTTSQR